MIRWMVAVAVLAVGCGEGVPLAPDEDDPACEVVAGRAEARFVIADETGTSMDSDTFSAKADLVLEPFGGRPVTVAEVWRVEDGFDWGISVDAPSGTAARLSVSARLVVADVRATDTHDFILDRRCDYVITVGPALTFSYAWRMPQGT